MAQEQLTLDLQIRPAPSLGNFAVGDNAELVAVLSAVENARPSAQFIYIWGGAGVGRTHLLHAIDPLAGFERVPRFAPGRRIYTVDDVDALSEPEQQQLFDLMNEVYAHPGSGGVPDYCLVTAGSRPPSQMKGRPDVLSRLSWGLVFQVRPLTDEQKDRALAKIARDSRIELPDDARQWLLLHLPRDMGTLTEAVFEVERYALKTSRRVTRALVRQCFAPKRAEEGQDDARPQPSS